MSICTIAKWIKNEGVDEWETEAGYKYLDVDSDSDNIIFCIRQEQGVRVKTIMNYKADISLAIGAECEMKLMSEKGCIGIFVPVKCCRIFNCDNHA